MTQKKDLIRILERVQSAAQFASRYVRGESRRAFLEFAEKLAVEIEAEIKLR